MNFKTMLRSKTFWTGISAIAGGISMIIIGDTHNGFTAIVGGLGMIFIRDAITGKN